MCTMSSILARTVKNEFQIFHIFSKFPFYLSLDNLQIFQVLGISQLSNCWAKCIVLSLIDIKLVPVQNVNKGNMHFKCISFAEQAQKAEITKNISIILLIYLSPSSLTFLHYKNNQLMASRWGWVIHCMVGNRFKGETVLIFILSAWKMSHIL